MNRRGFLQRLVTGAVGAAILSRLPVSIAEPVRRAAGLTFSGIPIVWDEQCPPGVMFLINRQAVINLKSAGLLDEHNHLS